MSETPSVLCEDENVALRKLLREIRTALHHAGFGPEYGRPGQLDILAAVIDATLRELPVRSDGSVIA